MSVRGNQGTLSEAADALSIDHDVPTLRERVLDALREAILEFRLKPGQKVVERTLCEALGVSRTSVREALRHLEAEGLVESRPHRGRYVAAITPEEAQSLYEVRAQLEGLAVELFTVRASDVQIEALQQAMVRLEKAYRGKRPLVMLRAKSEFYDVLFDGCGNSTCGDIARSLHARVSYLRGMSLSAAGRTAESLAEIRRIVEEIHRRDPEAARKACMEHVENASRVAQQTLEQQER